MADQRVARLLDLDVLGQGHRQLVARHRHDPAGAAVDHRDRAAPVALARDAPVAQPERDLAAAETRRLDVLDHPPLGARDVQPVQEARVDQPAVADVGLVADREALRVGARRQDHRDHRAAVLARELEVALVVRRAAEDRAGAVLHEHEIGDVDRQLLGLAQRIAAAEPGVVAALLGLLDRLLAGADPGAFGDEGGKLRVAPGELEAERMIGRDRHEARAEQRVGAGREDLEPVVPADDRKPDPGALGAADPLLLHQPDLVRPALQAVQGVEQVLAVVGDLEEPLGELAALDQGARAPAAAVDHLLVGEHRLIDRVPVDPGFLAVDQPRREEVEEHRLLVAIVVGIAGRELARPVERQTHRLELRPHLRDVGPGPGRRVDALGDRGVLGRHAEGVPAHGVEHIVALGAPAAGHHVAERVVAHVAHVDAPRRVGEHLEHVIFAARRRLRRPERGALVPDPLATSPRSP